MIKYEYYQKSNFKKGQNQDIPIQFIQLTLNNDEVYKRTSLLLVPKSTVSDEKYIILQTNKQSKDERFLKSEGVDTKNILETKRGKNKLLEALK
jgi:hypothetical protein